MSFHVSLYQSKLRDIKLFLCTIKSENSIFSLIGKTNKHRETKILPLKSQDTFQPFTILNKEKVKKKDATTTCTHNVYNISSYIYKLIYNVWQHSADL